MKSLHWHVLRLTYNVYWMELDYIKDHRSLNKRLVLLSNCAHVASASWVVTNAHTTHVL